MIPKFTTPQAKMIRTLEGLILVGFNLAMIVIPILTNALPAPTAAKVAALVDTGGIVGRSLAKGIMGWQTPMMPDVPASVHAAKADTLRAQVKKMGGDPVV